MKFPVYVIVGLVLFILYLLQDIGNIRWEFLVDLQAQEGYKRWSGLLLGFFILMQWGLTFVKTSGKLGKYSVKITELHKWTGSLTPLVFYLHSVHLGFAYLFVLSITFLGNFVLGLLNSDVLKIRAQWYTQGWMIVHVAFSLLISMLMVYHVWVVFYYE